MASVSKRTRDGRTTYVARWRDPDGRQRKKSFPRKADADRYLTGVSHSILTGAYVDPTDRTTFRDYAEDWRLAQVHRPSSRSHVETMLRRHAYPAFGERPLSLVRPSEVQAWVARLSLTLAPATVSVVHGLVAAVFKAAVRDRKVTGSPCEGTRLPASAPSEVVPLELAVVTALRGELPERYRAIVDLAAGTGLRPGEWLGLTVDRSGLQPPRPRPMLKVDRQLSLLPGEDPYLSPPKTPASYRSVPLPKYVVDAVAAHLAAFPPEPREVVVKDAAGRSHVEVVAFVFTDDGGGPIRRTSFSRLWRPAVRRAGAPDGTRPHDLRHFYASLLIRHGESVKTVQSRLGHATAAETLDTYSHLWPDSDDRTREAVDGAFGTHPAVGTRGNQRAAQGTNR